MSTPPPLPPKTSALGKSSPSPSPETTPRQEPRVYTRAPPSDFGDRLASARHLAPSAAPPPPPPRTTVSADSAGVSVLPSGFPPLGANTVPKYAAWYGPVKGSYISPFDSGGKTPGDQRLSASSTTVEEFEAKYGSEARLTFDDAQSEGSDDSDGTVHTASAGGRTIFFGQMPPVAVRDKGKVRAVSVSERKVAVTAPEGARDRQIFFGPLKLVRKACAEKATTMEAMKLLSEWLDEKMPEPLETVLERDPMIKEVVIRVTIPMTNEDWSNYNQILPHFKDALDMHNALANANEEFDQVTKAHKEVEGIVAYQREEPQLTRPQLMVPGLSLEEILAGMVRRQQLGRPWDWGRSTYGPELLPEELGGDLKGYPHE